MLRVGLTVARWQDYGARPLLERKAALYGVFGQRGGVRHTGHFADSSAGLWQLAVQLELEGIDAKDARSAYVALRPSRPARHEQSREAKGEKR